MHVAQITKAIVTSSLEPHQKSHKNGVRLAPSLKNAQKCDQKVHPTAAHKLLILADVVTR